PIGRATAPWRRVRARSALARRTAFPYPCTRPPKPYYRFLGWQGEEPAARIADNQSASPGAERNARVEVRRLAMGPSALLSRSDSDHQQPCSESGTRGYQVPPATSPSEHPASLQRSTSDQRSR